MEDDWIEYKDEIQKTINDWRLDSRENLYVIAGEDVPKIIASSIKDWERIVGKDALPYEATNPSLIKTAFLGEQSKGEYESKNEDRLISHLAYPVFSDVGKVKGIIYMTSDLKDVSNMIKEAKIILTNATLIALAITITLGFLIANSIVEPIRDVTEKAKEMAKGDFNQTVEVKSNDEIGQLANMFNYLTKELKQTISDMDIERSKLDTIFKYMAEGVVAMDMEGYIIHANPIALDILGIEQNGSFLKNKEKTLFPYEKINFNQVNYEDETSLEGDEISEVDGEIYKIKYAPFKNEIGQVGGLILVLQNMTNEHRLDNMRKEFVANVSHELKTPITTIKSYTETLMLGDIDSDVQLNFLHTIDDECNRMNRLVKDLLQLSNLDFKKTVWKKKEVDINNFVKDIVDRLKLSFKEKEQKYSLNLKEVPRILIDKDAIEQVVLNIVSNAIKYTENKGSIFIETEASDNFVTIRVKDSGIGIPEEDLERIFERFYRVEKGRSRELGGTGLGLAIAKEIVEGHNGFISINSVYKEGTVVEIKLPM